MADLDITQKLRELGGAIRPLNVQAADEIDALRKLSSDAMIDLGDRLDKTFGEEVENLRRRLQDKTNENRILKQHILKLQDYVNFRIDGLVSRGQS